MWFECINCFWFDLGYSEEINTRFLQTEEFVVTFMYVGVHVYENVIGF